MNRPHFRRHPRPVDPEPTRTRYDAEWPDVRAAERDEPWELPLLRAQDAVLAEWVAAEWSSLPPVFAPHTFVGGDLAAMAAPWPGMARDDLGTYAEPVEPHGRHRQTDPLDLILADLRDIEDRLS